MPDKNNFNCVVQQDIVRRLTPKECCRLQGMPDHWCGDVPHKDSPEYKMWGNGMALPCVLYVIENIKQTLIRRGTNLEMKGDEEQCDEQEIHN